MVCSIRQLHIYMHEGKNKFSSVCIIQVLKVCQYSVETSLNLSHNRAIIQLDMA